MQNLWKICKLILPTHHQGEWEVEMTEYRIEQFHY
ncbi:hypothetical protein B6N60_00673 [Richelia sinica FACHB-800]|uniref:Uncharacterized protein n=1 Tax=Richelia sinica FACHB-800 TaxID=1357546 RepID=A0A975T4W2_9NOST|nr:hypothetical protein B6N60_00673 [Richelia sinica FACHB-800]